MPSGIVAGEKLIVFFGCSNDVTVNTPSGWTKGVDGVHPTSLRIVVYTKIAVGGDTLTVTTSSNTIGVNITYRVLTNNDIEFSSTASGSSINPNPPSLTPAGGSQQYIYFAAALSSGVTFPGYPSNYTDNQVTNTGGTYDMAVATRSLTSASDDPGTFTMDFSGDWVTCTVSAEPQTPASATAPLLTSTSGIFQPTIDFAADATFPIIEAPSSTIFVPTAYADDSATWANESRNTATWTNV